jgi:hypothetical protein
MLVQRNVTRLCSSYVPATCNEVCLQQTVDAILNGKASNSSHSASLAAIVAPVVVGSGGWWWTAAV